jgi:hypothetical protein
MAEAVGTIAQLQFEPMSGAKEFSLKTKSNPESFLPPLRGLPSIFLLKPMADAMGHNLPALWA